MTQEEAALVLAKDAAAAEARYGELQRQLDDAQSAMAAAQQGASAEADSRGKALAVGDALRTQLTELQVCALLKPNTLFVCLYLCVSACVCACVCECVCVHACAHACV